MKKILLGLFVFGFLAIGSQANAFSLKDAVSLRIQSLNNEIIKLTASLKASALDPVITVTSTSDLTPRISYWWGKVNQHVDIASMTWQTDPDGSSGASIDKLTYCKKWYPNTTSVAEYKIETINTWHDAGNLNSYIGYKMSYECVESVSIPSLITIRPADYVNGIYGDSVSDDAVVPVFAVTVLASAQASIEGISIMSDRSGISSIMSDFKINDGMTMGPTNIITKSVRGPFYNANGTTQYDLIFDDVLNANQTKTYVVYAKIENGASGSFRFGIGGVSHSISLSTVNGVGTWGSYRNIISSIPPSITVISPNGGESIEAGSKIEVQWSALNIPNIASDSVMIQINRVEPVIPYGTWVVLTKSVPNSGRAILTLPGTLIPGKYELSVRRNSLLMEGDISDNLFTIRAATIPISSLPILSSPTATLITSSSATIGATVNSSGIPAATIGGVCIDRLRGRTNCSTGSVSKLLSRTVSGLSPNTTYYYSSYATNTVGTGWSPVYTVTTSTSPTSDSCMIKSFKVNGADYAKISQNELAILSWETSNCAKVIITGVTGTDGSPLSGSVKLPNPLITREYFLTAYKSLDAYATDIVTTESVNIEVLYPTDPLLPKITVLSPNGGETYKVGDKIEIRWKTENISADARMYVCVKNGSLPCTTLSTLNTGQTIYDLNNYKYVNIPGNNFKVAVYLGATTPYNDTSDNTFTITSTTTDNGCPAGTLYSITTGIACPTTVTSSVTVLSPNGGEIYKQGAPIAISLSGGIYLTKVGLVYPDFDPNKPISDGNNVYWLSAATDAGKSYVWDGLSYQDQSGWRAGTGNYKILAIRGDYGIKCDPISNCAYDISDNYFTIKSSVDLGCNGTTYSSTTGQACPLETISSKITVLSPNGGEIYKVGDIINFKWKSNNVPENSVVTIALVDEIGSNFYLLNPNCFTSSPCINIHNGNFNINIPNTILPGSYKARVVCNVSGSDKACTYTGYEDLSDNYFTIKPAVDTTVDHGCSAGQNYSSTTGKPCSQVVIKDDSCMHGYNFSHTTGKACSGYTTVNTYQPASSINAATPIKRTLRIGIRGDDVKRLQEFLNLLADGSFGPKTAAKVKEWQAANGLAPDGAFGRQSIIKAGLTD